MFLVPFRKAGFPFREDGSPTRYTTLVGNNKQRWIPSPPPPSPFSLPGRGNRIIAGRGKIETGGFWDGLLGTWDAFTKGHFLDFVEDHDVGK